MQRETIRETTEQPSSLIYSGTGKIYLKMLNAPIQFYPTKTYEDYSGTELYNVYACEALEINAFYTVDDLLSRANDIQLEYMQQ